MYSKKTRIISFLMAFLLIFTFAFINPLTVSKSYAVFPAVVLTSNGVKIIMGALASVGIGFTAGQALQEVDFEKAAESIANVVYRTLDGAEKLALMALSVVDNVVEVPVALYNAIVNNAKKVFETAEYSQTLLEQGISIKYANLSSDNSDDPDLQLPIYQLTDVLASSTQDTRVVDMREAEPFLIYDGTQSATNSFPLLECVTKNYFDFSSESNPLLVSSNSDYLIITPSIRGYNIKVNSSKYANCISFRKVSSTEKNLYFSDYANGNFTYTNIGFPTLGSRDMTGIIIYWYLIRNSDGYVGVHYDVYENGEFLRQRQFIYQNEYGLNSVITSDNLYDTPSGLDTTINVETSPSPVITNTDASANILTLPTTVADTIGLTSSDVNVGSTDVPDVPNTEIMENINTNVGELVTGGTLGEQVNTNIVTVEGLHGELTEQVDFGAVFDTIAQYISSLDISSVTWFPTAVASFLVPFLPVISLGLILFFIDRVLNGGA